MSRTFEQIVEDIRQQFNNTSLEKAASSYGVLYTLIRGMAATCYAQEQEITGIVNAGLVSSSQGNDLDVLANTYGLSRRPGTSSFGTVLAKATNTTKLLVGAQLQNVTGTITLETTKEVVVSADREALVPVTSITQSSNANLVAGTPLYFINSDVSAVVGSYRDNTKQLIGNLIGGSSSESDDALRARLNTFIFNKGLVNKDAIISQLQSYVNTIHIVERRPAPGYTTIYIDTANQLVIDKVISTVNNIKAVGVLFVVKSLQYQPVDLDLTAYLTGITSDSVSTVVDNIKAAVEEYFSYLTVGDSVVVGQLTSYVTSKTGYTVSVNKPATTITPIINEYLLIPSEVVVSVKSR